MPHILESVLRYVLCLCFIMLVAPPESYATDDVAEAKDEVKIFDTFTLYWENDTFAGTDRDYSNGIKLHGALHTVLPIMKQTICLTGPIP